MFEIVNGFRKEATIFEFEGITCVAEKCKYAANMSSMFLRIFRKDNNVGEIDKCKLPFDS